jgi:hypothetical protein
MLAKIILNMGKFKQHLACVLKYKVDRRWTAPVFPNILQQNEFLTNNLRNSGKITRVTNAFIIVLKTDVPLISSVFTFNHNPDASNWF